MGSFICIAPTTKILDSGHNLFYDNVYLINGDRHWQYVTHPEGTNLWEFSTGAGSDVHAGGWPQSDLRPEHRFLRVKGGFLRGLVSRESGSPTLTFQHLRHLN